MKVLFGCCRNMILTSVQHALSCVVSRDLGHSLHSTMLQNFPSNTVRTFRKYILFLPSGNSVSNLAVRVQKLARWAAVEMILVASGIP